MIFERCIIIRTITICLGQSYQINRLGNLIITQKNRKEVRYEKYPFLVYPPKICLLFDVIQELQDLNVIW